MYFLWLAPAMLLAFIAQTWIRSAYARASQLRATMTGAEAARYILDKNGLVDIPVEETPGQMSDHYDPGDKVVRLSTEVYHSPSLASVGIAAHEVGHAMQHAFGYLPLVLRNLAVPLARFGSPIGMLMLLFGIGMIGSSFGRTLAWGGVALFGTVAIFQIINLPVEFNASTRGKQQLVQLGIVDANEMAPVRSVLTAAALTYVAATLQSVLQVLYYASLLMGAGRRRD
jgi:Zn-dependent membrane protease YugP